MANQTTYDVIIIGAGPGGYVAAIRAARLKLKVCVIEKDKLGGVCLNWGCIPSKNLIHQAELYHARDQLEEIGVAVDIKGLNYGKVHKKSREATERLNNGVKYLLNKNKVEVISGTAKIIGPNKIKVNDKTVIEGKNIIIATGSRPAEIPGFEFDEKLVLSSTGILSMAALPESLIILGAGAIGCEFAYVMNAFGVKVTLVEMMDHILPFEDDEVGATLQNAFMAEGIKIFTDTRAMSLRKENNSVTVTLQDKGGKQQTVTAGKALCVFGRKPNTENIGLDQVGLTTDKGYIPVGDYYQTAVKSIFAIGDVVATPLLAHVASKEGEIAVEYIAGRRPDRKIDATNVPSCTYCEPQVASFGLRERDAQEKKIPYKKFQIPYQSIGKAVAVNKAQGGAKLLCDPQTHEILGCHIIGYNATELIHEFLLAKSAELLPEDIARMIHAHPTVSEIAMETAKSVYGEAIHY